MAYKVIRKSDGHNFYPGETFRTRARAIEARVDAKRITGNKAMIVKVRRSK